MTPPKPLFDDVHYELSPSGKYRFYVLDSEGKKHYKTLKIRKLTPRECFRLMDVDEVNIDKIQASGLSNSAQYQLAGNSIVVNCMYEIFRSLFYGNKGNAHEEGKQLTLF